MKRVALKAMVLGLAAAMAALVGCSGQNSALKIGLIAPLSGDAKEIGLRARDAMQLACDEINSGGGVRGKGVQVVAKDDTGDAAKAVESFRSLVDEENIQIVFGGYTDEVAQAIAEAAQKEKVLFVRLFGGADILPAVGNFNVTFGITDELQASTLADYLIKDLGKQSVAIWSDAAMPRALSIADKFKAKFEELGGKVPLLDSYNAGGSGDAASFVQQAIDQKADAVFVPGGAADAAKVGAALKAKGSDILLFGSDEWQKADSLVSGDDLVGALYIGEFFLNAVYPPLLQKYEPFSPVEFLKAYAQRHGKPAKAVDAMAYDAVYLLADAVSAAYSDAIEGGVIKLGEYPIENRKMKAVTYSSRIASAVFADYKFMTERIQSVLVPEAGEPWSKMQYLAGRLALDGASWTVTRPLPIIEIVKDNDTVTDRLKAVK